MGIDTARSKTYIRGGTRLTSKSQPLYVRLGGAAFRDIQINEFGKCTPARASRTLYPCRFSVSSSPLHVSLLPPAFIQA